MEHSSPALTKNQVAGLLQRNILLIVGLCSLIFPTLWALAHNVWSNTDQEHGPIILLLVLWVFWRELPAVICLPDRPVALGWLCIIPALCVYIVGYSQQIWFLSVGCFIPLLIGVLLITKGWRSLITLRFPLFFIIFLIPLPGVIVDAVTSGLKQNISTSAEVLLYHIGYPVARSGVTLMVGQYQLLVADACSGINSLFSLSALGFLYLYLHDYSSFIKKVVFMMLIPPVAILANIMRVMVLVLVTYHFGDEAGQGFIHGAAGIFLFIVALLSLYIIDRVLTKLTFNRAKK